MQEILLILESCSLLNDELLPITSIQNNLSLPAKKVPLNIQFQYTK